MCEELINIVVFCESAHRTDRVGMPKASVSYRKCQYNIKSFWQQNIGILHSSSLCLPTYVAYLLLYLITECC